MLFRSRRRQREIEGHIYGKTEVEERQRWGEMEVDDEGRMELRQRWKERQRVERAAEVNKEVDV